MQKFFFNSRRWSGWVVFLREGHFPGELFRDLLEYEVDLTQAKAANQQRFASHELSPHDLRRALLEMIHSS